MTDLTPEEREKIYLEEKARRETEARQAEPESPEVASEPIDAIARESENRRKALQRLVREEEEARTRLDALLAFERQEKELQNHRNSQLRQDYEDKKAQEKLRLEKWQRGSFGKREMLQVIGFVGLMLLLFLGGLSLKVGPVVIPVIFGLCVAKARKMPARQMAGLGLLAFVVLWGLYLSRLKATPVSETIAIPYQIQTDREAALAKQIKLQPEQLMELARQDLGQVDLDSPDVDGQKRRLRQARVELDEIEGTERNRKPVMDLYAKIDALSLAIQRRENQPIGSNWH